MADQDTTVVADGTTGVEPGTTEPTQGVAAEAEPQSFYSYTHPDGRVDDYKTPDDVSRFIRKGTMRFDDFNTKSGQLTQDREALTNRERAIESGAQTLLQRRSEYDRQHGELERVLQAMPRDQYARLKADVQGGRQAEPQLPPEVMSRLQKLEQGQVKGDKLREQEDHDRKVEEIHKVLGGQYEDYDTDGVNTVLEELLESPDEDALRSLYELAYWGGKGRQGVAGMQAEAVNRGAVRTGKQAPVKSPKGKVKADGEVLVHKNLEEAEKAARAEGY